MLVLIASVAGAFAFCGGLDIGSNFGSGPVCPNGFTKSNPPKGMPRWDGAGLVVPPLFPEIPGFPGAPKFPGTGDPVPNPGPTKGIAGICG